MLNFVYHSCCVCVGVKAFSVFLNNMYYNRSAVSYLLLHTNSNCCFDVIFFKFLSW